MRHLTTVTDPTTVHHCRDCGQQVREVEGKFGTYTENVSRTYASGNYSRGAHHCTMAETGDRIRREDAYYRMAVVDAGDPYADEDEECTCEDGQVCPHM